MKIASFVFPNAAAYALVGLAAELLLSRPIR